MNTVAREPYHSDLTNPQWEILEPLIPAAKEGGRPRDVDMREVINTILYLNRTGCQWDMLPHDLLPKSTVYDYFAEWRDDGTWQRMMDALREQSRMAAGREPTPSPASIDSQSVKTTKIGGERGYDGAKKVTGRKRHIFVDTLGLLLAVTVTTAATDDAAAAPRVSAEVQPELFPRLEKVWPIRSTITTTYNDGSPTSGRNGLGNCLTPVWRERFCVAAQTVGCRKECGMIGVFVTFRYGDNFDEKSCERSPRLHAQGLRECPDYVPKLSRSIPETQGHKLLHLGLRGRSQRFFTDALLERVTGLYGAGPASSSCRLRLVENTRT